VTLLFRIQMCTVPVAREVQGEGLFSFFFIPERTHRHLRHTLISDSKSDRWDSSAIRRRGGEGGAGGGGVGGGGGVDFSGFSWQRRNSASSGAGTRVSPDLHMVPTRPTHYVVPYPYSHLQHVQSRPTQMCSPPACVEQKNPNGRILNPTNQCVSHDVGECFLG
jgi:hypothetical protein